MLVIIGIGIITGIALGLLVSLFDPAISATQVKALFFIAGFIATMVLVVMVTYAIAVLWHNGWKYFFAKYIGEETEYFKTAFRRGVLATVLIGALVALKHFDFFTLYFICSAVVIVLVLELFYTVHERHEELNPKI